MRLAPIQQVGLLAVLYREAWLAGHERSGSIEDDFENCSGEVSIARLFASQRLTWLDWQLLRSLDGPADFLRVARRADPLRAEALMHAVPPNGRCSGKLWAAPYRLRWPEVRICMRAFEEQGVALTRDEVESLAAWVWQFATGSSFADYLDAWQPA